VLIDIRLLLKAIRTQLYIRHNISTCKQQRGQMK